MYRLAFRTDKGFKLGTRVYTDLEEAKQRLMIFKEEFSRSDVVIILDTLEEIKVVVE